MATPANHHGARVPRERGGGVWTLVKWGLVGIALFLFAGLGMEGLRVLRNPGTPLFAPGVPEFCWALGVFSVGGGVTFGLLVFAWSIVAQGEPFARVVALVGFALFLFALVVWPTPYKYYWDTQLGFIVRISRLTGHVVYQERPAASPRAPVAVPTSASADAPAAAPAPR